MLDKEHLSPLLLGALEYWQSKVNAGGIPGRQDIDPVEIPNLLPWTALTNVERTDTQFRFNSRLVGTGVVERFGRDITGKSAGEVYDHDYTAALEQRYLQVIEAGEPTLWHRAIQTKGGKAISYDRLILPLARDGQNIDMLMNVFDFGQLVTRYPAEPIPPGWCA